MSLYQKTVLKYDTLFHLHLFFAHVPLGTHRQSQGRRQEQSLDGFAHVNPLICTESGEKAQWRPFCSEAKVLPDLCTCVQELLRSVLKSFFFYLSLIY